MSPENNKPSYGRSFEAWRQACVSALGPAAPAQVTQEPTSAHSAASSQGLTRRKASSSCSPCRSVFSTAAAARRSYVARSALESSIQARSKQSAEISSPPSEEASDSMLGRPETEEEQDRKALCEQWKDELFRTSALKQRRYKPAPTILTSAPSRSNASLHGKTSCNHRLRSVSTRPVAPGAADRHPHLFRTISRRLWPRSSYERKRHAHLQQSHKQQEAP